MSDGTATVETPPAAPGATAAAGKAREGRLARSARRIPRPGWTFLAFAIYTFLAVELTWPLAKDPGNTIFGAIGDLTGSMAVLRELVEGGHNPFLPGTIDDFAAPDGQEIAWSQNVASFASTSMLYALAIPFGAMQAYSLFTVAGYIASGTLAFALVKRLIGNPWIALLIGWAFAFYPFTVSKGAGHVHFVHGWIFVLVLWAMLRVYERPTTKRALVAGAATVIAMAWSPYFLLFAGLEWAALAAVLLALPLIRRRGDFRAHLRAHAIAAAPILLFAAGLAAIATFSAQGTGAEDHTIEALIVYAARPFEYLLPSPMHPVWGDELREFRESRLHGSNFSETNLYVGLSLVALAIVGIVAAVRRRLPPRLGVVVLAVSFMGIVALAFSAPPKVAAFGELWPFPSLLTYEVSGNWRVYSRLVMVVMLAVCVLAAIGLFKLLEGRSYPARVLLLVGISTVVVIDLLAVPQGTNPIGNVPAFERLKEMPPGIAASYPLEPSGVGDYSTEFSQQWHDKPVLNGYAKDSLAERRALELDDLENPRTAGRLRALGVRYVLVDHVPIGDQVQDPGTPGRGFRYIMDDGYQALYTVNARPETLVTFGPGFGVIEYTGDIAHRWLNENDAELELLGGCNPCRGKLGVTAESFEEARTITLIGEDGRTIDEERIPTKKTVRLTFDVNWKGRETLKVRVSPGPKRVSDVLPGATDDRALGVSMIRPRLEVR